MNPLPNEWAITHRADVCAMTHRPFVPGEYFYTLLYHSAAGYRREDLSEEAWQNRNENIQPFSFWKSRYEPLPPKPPGASAEGKRGTTLPPFNCFEKSACERLLCPCRDARAETRPETSEDGREYQWACFDLRTRRNRRCIHRTRSAIAARRAGKRAKRSGGPTPDRGTWLKDPHASSLVFRTISSLPRADGRGVGQNFPAALQRIWR